MRYAVQIIEAYMQSPNGQPRAGDLTHARSTVQALAAVGGSIHLINKYMAQVEQTIGSDDARSITVSCRRFPTVAVLSCLEDAVEQGIASDTKVLRSAVEEVLNELKKPIKKKYRDRLNALINDEPDPHEEYVPFSTKQRRELDKQAGYAGRSWDHSKFLNVANTIGPSAEVIFKKVDGKWYILKRRIPDVLPALEKMRIGTKQKRDRWNTFIP